jgi:hypothetical protein
MQCCDDKDIDFTIAFAVPGSPRLPADGAPLSAYFDNFVTAGPGIEMDHPRVQHLIAGEAGPGEPILVGPPTPIDETGGILPLNDEDLCDKPQLAFAIGAILSGS